MNELEKLNKNINTDEVDLVPVNTQVLLDFYEENPYRLVEKTEGGLIVGVESTKNFKSNETGEMERNRELIACAKVLAAGKKCENVMVGDDVFVARINALPVPFRKKGWYSIAEQNIITIIRKKNE